MDSITNQTNSVSRLENLAYFSKRAKGHYVVFFHQGNHNERVSKESLTPQLGDDGDPASYVNRLEFNRAVPGGSTRSWCESAGMPVVLLPKAAYFKSWAQDDEVFFIDPQTADQIALVKEHFSTLDRDRAEKVAKWAALAASKR